MIRPVADDQAGRRGGTRTDRSARVRTVLIWPVLALLLVVPIAVAATSPLLQWRGPAYIAAGLAGVVALALLLVQPLLAANVLPGPSAVQARRMHAMLGAALVALVVLHVAGLWITSPPDVIDVLLFRSPTPFSVWGAIAMWALFAAALLAALRRPWRLRPRRWRRAHTTLAAVTVAATVMHAMLIEGTMGAASKTVLCAFVVAATAWALFRERTRENRHARST